MSQHRRPTIYQIAEMAGVSIGTVSRVMNGKDRVAQGTRERVMAIAEKFDYQPNAAARGLATSRTDTLMFLVSDIGNLYFSEMAKQVSARARNRGFRLILADSDETIQKEADYLRALADGHVDGAIVAPLSTPTNTSYYNLLRKQQFPLVLLDTELEGISASSVRVDNVRGGRMAVEYLNGKGHERIAFVSGNIEFQTNRLRYQGFREAHTRLDLPIQNDYLVLNQDFLQQEEFCGIEGLLALRKPPTAIFATSDLTAMACIHKIRASGRKVPDDVAVVGFDDIIISTLMEVPLTTIQQPKSEIARQAVELLLKQFQKDPDDVARVEHVLIEPKLVERASA